MNMKFLLRVVSYFLACFQICATVRDSITCLVFTKEKPSDILGPSVSSTPADIKATSPFVVYFLSGVSSRAKNTRSLPPPPPPCLSVTSFDGTDSRVKITRGNSYCPKSRYSTGRRCEQCAARDAALDPVDVGEIGRVGVLFTLEDDVEFLEGPAFGLDPPARDGGDDQDVPGAVDEIQFPAERVQRDWHGEDHQQPR
nr:hypothetical protein CFP56_37270 [Quercus suber]